MSSPEAEEDERRTSGPRTLAKTGNLCYPEPVPTGCLSCAAATLRSFSGLWMEDHPRQGFSPGFTIQHADLHSVMQNQISLPGILHQNLIIRPKNPLTFGRFYTMIISREHLFGERRRLREPFPVSDGQRDFIRRKIWARKKR